MLAKQPNVRILLSLLKQYGVKRLVISPGTKHLAIVKSVEDDPFFTCYSVVDERGAAYFAIGLTLDHADPVALVSTSASATRNYIPGMTEAYYRRAPVVAITGDYDACYTDQQWPQSIRQMEWPSDAARVSVDLPIVKDDADYHLVVRRVNQALDALSLGPAHINLRTDAAWEQGDSTLKPVRKITRHTALDEWPKLGHERILVVIGSHPPFTQEAHDAISHFASRHNAAVYVSHISNYHGAGAVHGTGVFWVKKQIRPDLLITIGGVLGDYPLYGALRGAEIPHWHVSPSGAYADTFKSLVRLFDCPEQLFFRRFADNGVGSASTYHAQWLEQAGRWRVPDLPLSQSLVAVRLAPKLPAGTNLHLGILNALRNWELVPLDPTIRCYSNVGSFGIDGGLSTFLGQAVATDALCVMVVGDLSFFYDMNAIGNRHIKANIRIVLINNNGGAEFLLPNHPAARFGQATNRHTAAEGHFGGGAKGWVENNNMRYASVTGKEQLDAALAELVRPSERPLVLEVFTTKDADAAAVAAMRKANK